MKKYVSKSYSTRPHETLPESITFHFKTKEELKEFENSID